MFSHDTLAYFKTYLNEVSSNYLEIGVYDGESIKELAIAHPDKIIIGVDPFVEDSYTSHNSGISQGEKLITQRESTLAGIENLTNVKFYEMTSEKFYKNLTQDIIKSLNVGAVYIDGSHWYEDVVNDYKLALDLLGDKNGAVCFDDTHVDDVIRACDEFVNICGDRIIDKIDLTISNSVYILKSNK